MPECLRKIGVGVGWIVLVLTPVIVSQLPEDMAYYKVLALGIGIAWLVFVGTVVSVMSEHAFWGGFLRSEFAAGVAVGAFAVGLVTVQQRIVLSMWVGGFLIAFILVGAHRDK